MEQTVARIEALIHEDVGRGIQPLCRAARGGLFRASAALAATANPRIGLLTGFFIPAGDPPAAETDGPAGAALMALGFARAGVACRVLTDPLCRAACEAALAGAGLASVPVDTVDGIEVWRGAGIDWAIAVERCGRTADGTLRNMRGEPVAGTPLDEVFTAGPWRTIAIGDGGNEVGMGTLPPGLVARHIAFGRQIACVTPADHLIVAGVSHWGAYAMLAALAAQRPDWHAGLVAALDPAADRAILEALVANGPAVDGVTLRREPTIDGLNLTTHHRKLTAIRRLV